MTRPADAPTRPGPRYARWVVPLTALVIGLAYLVAGLIGDNLLVGLSGAVLMAAFAAVFVLGSRRSETLAGLMDRRDERINRIDSTASLVAGMTVLVAVIVAFMVDIARGGDGQPYVWLGALGGVTYAATLVYLRVRR